MIYCKAKLDKKATGKNIRSIIVVSQITIEELATMLGFGSPRVIYDWFNGSKLPNIESLYNLSKIFNMKMEDFLVIR